MISLPPKRIFTRLMLSYLMVTLAVLGVIGVIFIYLMQKYFFSVEGWQLAGRADKAVSLLHEPLLDNDMQALSRVADTLAFSYDVCLWVTDNRGSVLVISGSNPEKMGLRVEQNEINHVLEGNMITKQITGPDYNSLFYMTPIFETSENPDGESENDAGEAAGVDSRPVIGALAISSPLGPITATISGVTRLGLYAAFGATALAGLLGFTLSRNIAYPLEEMSRVALDMSRGNFQNRVRYRSKDELGQLAETLNFAVERVSKTIEEQQRMVKMQREFVSDISHEFRAPLTSQRGFLELIREGKIEAGDYRKYLEIIYQDTLHLGRLVQDLLDLANLESRQANPDRREHEPEYLLNRSLQHLQCALAEKNIALNMQIGDAVPLILVDEGRFHQVLTNLVENALHFSPPGGAITIQVDLRDRGALFKITDQGQGIPGEDMPFIWNRFYKVDKARTRFETGSGLGLAIVRQIVELHGGWVAVESEPGQGSTFSFWLPSSKALPGCSAAVFGSKEGILA